MTVLIVPAAGDSTRFEHLRPKFLLQHPMGKTMLAAGLEGIPDNIKRDLSTAVIVVQKEHMLDVDKEVLITQIKDSIGISPKFLELENKTNSQVDTIAKGIDFMGVDEPILVKDCDNFVSFHSSQISDEENFVAFADLRRHTEVVAFNKAFVQLDEGKRIFGIIEKEIISPFIFTGFAKFSSASSFMAANYSLEKQGTIFVSDIVKVLIDQGYIFFGLEAEEYEDWGTLRDWSKYSRRFASLLVDIDGVLSFNMSPIAKSKNWMEFSPIQENVESLLSYQESGKVKIVFLTSRSSRFKNSLREYLTDLGFRNFELICDLPHAKRILINDFADSNPYPSAIAINMERNSHTLNKSIFHFLN